MAGLYIVLWQGDGKTTESSKYTNITSQILIGYMSDRGLPFCPEIRIALAYLSPNAGGLSENLKYTQTANM